MQNRPILIMAGGTGGHVYPALAIADYLQAQGVSLCWLGSQRGMESRLVPAHGYTLFTINISGLRGKGIVRWLLAPLLLLFTTIKALGLLRRIRPAAVLGMGGFVSGPGAIAARCLRIPLCIHEQNAISGLTNRILARLADRVMTAFPNVFPDRIRTTVTGNPVRASITAIAPPQQRYRDRQPSRLRVLVLGGSQGARALNQLLPATLAALPSSLHLEVQHQCGERHLEETRACYAGIASPVQLLAFIDDMAAAYSWADLVICRAGALTLAEICSAGVASVLVPYPHAVDDHQTANARHLVTAGAAICLQEAELDSRKLQQLLHELSHDRARLLDMAVAARSLAHPDACRDVGRICQEVAYGR